MGDELESRSESDSLKGAAPQGTSARKVKRIEAKIAPIGSQLACPECFSSGIPKPWAACPAHSSLFALFTSCVRFLHIFRSCANPFFTDARVVEEQQELSARPGDRESWNCGCNDQHRLAFRYFGSAVDGIEGQDGCPELPLTTCFDSLYFS